MSLGRIVHFGCYDVFAFLLRYIINPIRGRRGTKAIFDEDVDAEAVHEQSFVPVPLIAALPAGTFTARKLFPG
jgi:hypothetical protein